MEYNGQDEYKQDDEFFEGQKCSKRQNGKAVEGEDIVETHAKCIGEYLDDHSGPELVFDLPVECADDDDPLQAEYLRVLVKCTKEQKSKLRFLYK